MGLQARVSKARFRCRLGSRLVRTLWKAVGTQTSSMVLHRAACSPVSRSVSNMVLPTVYMSLGWMPALCGGQAVVWNSG